MTKGIKQCPNCKNMTCNRTIICNCNHRFIKNFIKGTKLPDPDAPNCECKHCK